MQRYGNQQRHYKNKHSDKNKSRQAGSAAGMLVTLLMVVALLGVGAWLVMNDMQRQQEKVVQPATAATTPQTAQNTSQNTAQTLANPAAAKPEPIEPVMGMPALDAAATYQPQGNIIDVDISEYAGYAGLIAANGGLEPNPDSFFAKQYGFQVRLKMSEEEGWSKLNNGRIAAGVATTDSLAVIGRQFEAVVPVQIGFSRGADMVVVDTGIASINQLKGKVLAASQFNESEFFIRYLASEAGVPVKVLRDLDGRPAANELGLVFYEDATVACNAYQHELASAKPQLNGCVGWSPSTDEVIEASSGRAKSLVSNRNLLIVADILLLNKGFAAAHPDWAKGLVHGLLEGNRLVRENPETQLATISKAFKWEIQDTREELKKVHLSNLPENLAFFEGTIDAAGSFQGIFQSSVLAYGSLIRNPADPARFVDLTALKSLVSVPELASQTIAIAPIKTAGEVSLEGDALLSKDIRFFFRPNSAELENNVQNQQYLDTVKGFLQVSPGSIVLLRGHVDNANQAEFLKKGGQTLVNKMALKAMELSRQRAQAVRDALLARHPKIDSKRLELVGRGWEEPVSADSDINRRVEVQWFTLE